MKVIKCDICKTVVNYCDAATIKIIPMNLRKEFEFANGESSTVVGEESFELCVNCLGRTLRQYYGKNFGKGDDT